MQYSVMQSRVLKRFQDRTDLTTIIQDAINDIRAEICGGEISALSGKVYQHRWSFCFQSTTQATTAGTKNYANPTGNIEVLGVSNGTTILEKKDYDYWQDNYKGSLTQGDPEIWLPRNEEYWVLPIPNAVITLSVDYYGYLADLSGATNESALDRKFPMLVIDGASALVAEYLNQDNFYQIYSNRFEKKLFNAISSDKGLEVRKVRTRLHPPEDTYDDEYES